MLNIIPTKYQAIALSLANTYDPCVLPIDILKEDQTFKEFLATHTIVCLDKDLQILRSQLISIRDNIRKIGGMKSDNQALATLYPFITKTKWVMNIEQDEQLQISPDSQDIEAIVQMVALGAINLIVKYGVNRIHYCKAQPCEELFCDVSKSARQVFCSKRCANRFGIAQYRNRKLDNC